MLQLGECLCPNNMRIYATVGSGEIYLSLPQNDFIHLENSDTQIDTTTNDIDRCFVEETRELALAFVLGRQRIVYIDLHAH